jgi:UDP-GlcNAc:undecaprenyl-phosphate/decaprenyl-phosphate GlcNAc-1-phosphate transferase
LAELPIAALTAAFLGAGAATWAVTPLVARVARAVGAVDIPGGRRAHLAPTPRLGGVAVLCGLLLGAASYGLEYGFDTLLGQLARDELMVFLFPCLLVFVVGLIDDVRGLSPASRALAEALAATFLVQAGYAIDVVANPFGAPISLGIFAYPVTLLWVVGVTNAFNMIDGLDGLLGSVAIAALLGCAGVALLGERAASATLIMALAGSLAGFLCWNWNPARIFLGDSGSLLVGFAIAALSLKVARNPVDRFHAVGTLPLHVPLLICALPIAEMTLTIARRWVTGQPVWVGDRSHIHHVLVKKGLPVRRAVTALALVALLSSGAAVASRAWRVPSFLGLCVLLLALALLGLRWLGYLELRVLRDRLAQVLRGRGSLPDLVALASAGETIGAATGLADLHGRLRLAVAEGRFHFICVELSPRVAVALDGPARVIECQNPTAERFLAGREGVPMWLFSSAPRASELPELGSVTYKVPLTTPDGALGHLTCERAIEAADHTAYASITRYIAAPLAQALGRVAAGRPEVSSPI